jgi:hypothetical protein
VYCTLTAVTGSSTYSDTLHTSTTGIDGVLGMISSYPRVVRYKSTTFWLFIYLVSFFQAWE